MVAVRICVEKQKYYMYLDKQAVKKDKERKQAYEELMKDLHKSNRAAFEYIIQREMRIATLESELGKYENFFHMLKTLMPKDFDTHTPIK